MNRGAAERKPCLISGVEGGVAPGAEIPPPCYGSAALGLKILLDLNSRAGPINGL